MSLPDPLPAATFFDQFSVADVKIMLNWQQERSAAGGGDTLYADRAPALWTANITSIEMEIAEAESLMALINSRAGGLKTVLLYRTGLAYPSSDPDGTLFGSATPLVGTITDRLHVAFTGFPADYVIPRGTFFQVIFDTSRYYLGQFAETKTADGSGAVSAAEIAPPLPASVATGDAVTVAKPCGKFRIVPGTAFPKTAGPVTDVIQFSAEHTYSA